LSDCGPFRKEPIGRLKAQVSKAIHNKHDISIYHLELFTNSYWMGKDLYLTVIKRALIKLTKAEFQLH